MKFLYLFLLFSLFVCQVHSNCIWYGECGESGQGDDGRYNCKYTGPAKPQTDRAYLDFYKELCPQLYKEQVNPQTNETYVDTCCDMAQLVRYNKQLSVPKQLMLRCPSCYLNFRTFLCDFTCSPKQADFMQITQESDFNATTQQVVTLTYYITNSSTTEMYDSCKDVQYSASNQKIMDLLCGTSVDDCTPEKFVTFLGTNPETPFIFNMNLTDDPFQLNETVRITPANSTMYSCSRPFSTWFLNATACGCSDCQDVCPVPQPPPTVNPCKLFGFDCATSIAALLFSIFSIVFITTILIKDKIRPTSRQSETSNASISTSTKTSLGQRAEVILSKLFEAMGLFCARHPILIVGISIVVCSVLSSGFFLYFSVITDPVELWSPKTSETRLNKNFYDSHFRPFYRTTQLIIRPTDKTPVMHTTFTQSQQFSSTFDREFLRQVLELQNDVSAITAQFGNQTVSLEDICFQPLYPDNRNCTIQSVLNYYQNSMESLYKEQRDDFDQLLNDYLDHFQTCVASPTSVNDTLGLSCLGSFGGTIMPYVALGAYPSTVSSRGNKQAQYGNATALLITIIINNHNEEALNKKAEAWEAEVVKFMKAYKNPNMTISFSTERSIQDELDRESKSDISTILISYVAMFLYITLTLGKYRIFDSNAPNAGFSSIFVDMKFTLGLVGVVIVMLSVFSSIGLLSFLGIKATLIIFEVIPFLVLAVGVDNIFILVQNYQRDIKPFNEPLENQIARIVGKVGPSMLLTSISETMAFLLGALTPMPAVHLFALYAAMAVFINFLLQITCFVALMTVDCKRESNKRFDLLCCVQVSEDEDDESILGEQQEDGRMEKKNSGLLFNLFKNYYSKFLLSPQVRPIVVIMFLAVFFTSVSLVPKVSVGLDQKLSMPKDSYVLDYFKSLEKYLSVGVPVYFVIKNNTKLDYSNVNVQNMICSTSGCDGDSMLNQINQASLQADYTKLSIPANSWLDDFFDWVMSTDCCRVYKNDTNMFCPSTSPDYETLCTSCPVRLQPQTNNRPVRDDFYKYLRFYLSDNPGIKCAKGGHAAYGESLEIIKSAQNQSIYQIGEIGRASCRERV